MKINGKSQNKSLLRFTTAGSVDDGKSTLIGRLLYDSKSIFEDQMEHIVQSGKRLGREELDLSLLTDGLRAEREQGITIDVAYRYFATPARKFIIADTPGHVQYTRNMVTGNSTADLTMILIDARKGIVEQTRRHAFLASLLRVPHLLVCVNKMDLVDFDQVHLVDADQQVGHPQQRGQEGVAPGLLDDSLAGVDQDHGEVGGRVPGHHVARVLHVARCVGDDELAGRGGEVAVGHVDGDALLALGPQAVGQQREVRVVVAALDRHPLHGLELVLEDRLRIVEQTSDQGALAVVHRPGRGEPEQLHQKYPSRLRSSMAASLTRSSARVAPRSVSLEAATSRMMSSTVDAPDSTAPVQVMSPTVR